MLGVNFQTETLPSIRSHKKQQGFTLIELSIVLVIIGLLVGGVLVGQDMIKSAGVRGVISQLEKFDTAVNGFKDKYNCVPGDCTSASTKFTYTGVANTGNGNGAVTAAATVANDTTDYATAAGELLHFFPQLASTKFIEGSFSATPNSTNALATDGLRQLPGQQAGQGRHYDHLCGWQT